MDLYVTRCTGESGEDRQVGSSDARASALSLRFGGRKGRFSCSVPFGEPIGEAMPVYYPKNPEVPPVFHTSWDCEEGQKIQEDNLEVILTDHELCEVCAKIGAWE